MGLFDRVKVDFPLPELPGGVKPPSDGWQTKSFENALTLYRITEDGHLTRGLYEWRDDERAPLGARLEQVGEEPYAYHGDVFFYHHVRLPLEDGSDDAAWVEYCARFTEGELTKVFCVIQTALDGFPNRDTVNDWPVVWPST